jgi:hypothetical protein
LSEEKGFLRHWSKPESWRILTLFALVLFLISALNPFLAETPEPRFATIQSTRDLFGSPTDVFWSFKMAEYETNLLNRTRVVSSETYFWEYFSHDWSGYSDLYGYDGSPAQISTILLCILTSEIFTIAFGILALLNGKCRLLLASAVSAILTVLLMWLLPLSLNGTLVGAGPQAWFWFQHYVVIMLIASTLARYRTPNKPLNRTVTSFLIALFLIALIPTVMFFQGIATLTEFAIRTRGNFQTVITEDFYGFFVIEFHEPTCAVWGFTQNYFIFGGGGTILCLTALFFLWRELKALRKRHGESKIACANCHSL